MPALQADALSAEAEVQRRAGETPSQRLTQRLLVLDFPGPGFKVFPSHTVNSHSDLVLILSALRRKVCDGYHLKSQ